VKTYVELEAGPVGGRLIPVTEWSKYHCWPTIAGLRYYVFHAKQNGFDAVLRRVGRRLLISEAAFFAWVDSQNGARHGQS
jgi:hypothetical protein